MKTKHLILLTFLCVTAHAETFDLSRRFGVGGGAGVAHPILGNRFDDQADYDIGWNANARYQMSDALGLIFQYSQYEFEESTINAKVYDVT